MFNDRRRLFLKHFEDIDVVFIIFGQLFVNNLLKLTATGLSHEMDIEVSMNQLIPFKAFNNLLRVVIVRIRRQVHKLRIVHTRTLPGIMVRHQRDNFLPRSRRSLVSPRALVAVVVLLLCCLYCFVEVVTLLPLNAT